MFDSNESVDVLFGWLKAAAFGLFISGIVIGGTIVGLIKLLGL